MKVLCEKDNYKIIVLPVGQLQANCYVLLDTKKNTAVIVDPGDDASYIITILKDLRAVPKMIIATHGHFDHVMAAYELQATFNIPFYGNSDDQFLLDRLSDTAQHFIHINHILIPPEMTHDLKKLKKITFGDSVLHIINTPGHTPGSVCLYVKELQSMFVGDTIFAQGGVGRTDFKYASTEKLQTSLKAILDKPPQTFLLPGHGEATTIKKEKIFHENIN